MKRLSLVLLVVVLYALHQDFWFWRAARPLLFGFLPTGIWYHACFTLAVSLVMWVLIKQAWPAHLEEEAEIVEPALRPNGNPQPEGDQLNSNKDRAAQLSGTSRNGEGEAP
jgi:hypothetical protein